MSTIDSVVAASNVSVPATTTTASTSAKQTLNGEMFLNLLVAQLRYQDPSSPMDTKDMMNQTTQLASMEQLTSMSKLTQESFSLQMRMAASNLVGKQVSYTDADGKNVTGVATSVSFADSVPMVTIGDKSIRLDVVSGVASAS